MGDEAEGGCTWTGEGGSVTMMMCDTSEDTVCGCGFDWVASLSGHVGRDVG